MNAPRLAASADVLKAEYYVHFLKNLKGRKRGFHGKKPGRAGAVTLATKTQAKADRALAEQHIETALQEQAREVIDIMLCH